MKIISVNTNGIRAAAKKGFFDWMLQQDVDVVCIQETKAQYWQLQDPLFHPPGYHCFYFDAHKKGYSGVAIYSKRKPDVVHTGLGWEHPDTEGRYIEAVFGNLSVASLYLPSGTTSEERQAGKIDFLNRYIKILKEMRAKNHEYVICGDWNIAHRQIDLKNWRANQKHSGFLPEERAWLDQLFDEIGYIDAFRLVNQEPDQYTWWSNRGQAWAKNVGWRIDYQIITPGLKDCVQSASIYKEQRFSDHAPLILNYDLDKIATLQTTDNSLGENNALCNNT